MLSRKYLKCAINVLETGRLVALTSEGIMKVGDFVESSPSILLASVVLLKKTGSV